MSDMISSLQQAAIAAIESATSLATLEELRVGYLGKKGQLTEQMKTLGSLPPEERKNFGAAVNVAKQAIEAAIGEKQTVLEASALTAQLAEETLDLTLPVRAERAGRIHPITQTLEELAAIFAQMGFSVAEGPDIEDDEHNFNALNIPESHPARQMHDTFYMKAAEGLDAPVLRTHTSPVQIRAMRAHAAEFAKGNGLRIIAPGTTYRSDSDATHTPMFHQVEGLVIEKNIHMGHLKGTLEAFLKAYFGLKEVPLRFRPSFFPFTEPSAEVDIACRRGTDSFVLGEGTDWLEILGCGMVHANVLRNCGLDPAEWQGFAFGMGIERIAMLKYGMPDLRKFFESDLRWQEHYGFSPADVPAPGMAVKN
jgi:phenylalanyl-tRNA synthetase alpha chain